ncbi:MAG: hypothetical protein EOP45_16195 [Sphingobacteriaceae bacterium]|nr:MAG: hypothetical protein EOP45_16195 [Sphingobacteriaceae bacterium]
MPDGSTAYNFTSYAQQVIARDATDYASLFADESILDPSNIDGGERYKADFKLYYQAYLDMFIPGSRVVILNSSTVQSVQFHTTTTNPYNC